MKILINAISLKMGGSKVIINSFVENIPKDNNEYHFIVYPGVLNNIDYKKLNNNIIIKELDIGKKSHIERFLWDQIKLPKYIKRHKFDYMINMTNYGPAFPKCKQILLLHNAKHISQEIKKTLSMKDRFKLIIEDIILKFSLFGTYKLIVQTNYMKRGILNKFNFKEEDIIIIPNFCNKKNNDTKDFELEKLLNNCINKNDFVLSYISLYSPYKNFEKLIDAIEILKNNTDINVKLILTLDRNEKNEAEKILDEIKNRNLSNYIISVGNIENSKINQILKKSDVFIFPSSAESFGMPLIEAMNAGVPILASDLEFAHNVCEDAAIYFKYDNSLDIAEKIKLVINNKNILNELKEKSIIRSTYFNEEKIMGEYLSIIREEKNENSNCY